MADLTSGVGRIVQGNPSTGRTTNTYPGPNQGQALINKDGSPRTEYFFAVAFLKSDPEWNTVYAEIKRQAAELWPRGESTRPGFAFKITDGDDPKHEGKQGFAGCDVATFKQQNRPPALYKFAPDLVQITDPLEVKCGYQVKVSFQIASNKNYDKSGIHLNPSSILLWQVDEVIANFDPSSAWGGQRPPGATTQAQPSDREVLAQPPFSQGPPATAAAQVTPKAQGMGFNTLADIKAGLGVDEANARTMGLVV